MVFPFFLLARDLALLTEKGCTDTEAGDHTSETAVVMMMVVTVASVVLISDSPEGFTSSRVVLYCSIEARTKKF